MDRSDYMTKIQDNMVQSHS